MLTTCHRYSTCGRSLVAGGNVIFTNSPAAADGRTARGRRSPDAASSPATAVMRNVPWLGKCRIAGSRTLPSGLIRPNSVGWQSRRSKSNPTGSGGSSADQRDVSVIPLASNANVHRAGADGGALAAVFQRRAGAFGRRRPVRSPGFSRPPAIAA